MSSYQTDFPPSGVFIPPYQAYVPSPYPNPFPPFQLTPVFPPPFPYSEAPFQAEPIQAYVDMKPSAPDMDLEEDIKTSQRTEWLENKGSWKWEITAKVAIVAILILSGASLFALTAVPGLALALGIGVGVLGCSISLFAGACLATSLDWTNYADPETVEKILGKIKNSNTPLSHFYLNHLKSYGIISETMYKEVLSSEYQEQSKNFRKSLREMAEAGRAIVDSVEEERSQIKKQLHFLEILPESIDKQQNRTETINEKREQLAQAQANADKVREYFAQVNGKITQFNPYP